LSQHGINIVDFFRDNQADQRLNFSADFVFSLELSWGFWNSRINCT
jgi:hypothetical protein